MAKFISEIPSLIVMGASGTIKFSKGEFETDDKKQIADIESTPSFEYGDIKRVDEKPEKKEKEPKAPEAEKKEDEAKTAEPKTVSPQA